MILHEFLTQKIKTAHQNSDPPVHMPPDSQEVFRKHQTCAQHQVFIYELSADTSRPVSLKFTTIEPFLLLSPFSPRWISLHRGIFLPSTGGFLQPVGESARWQLTQSPETATHWNNHPAGKPPNVPILPVTGRIAPLERVYWRHE